MKKILALLLVLMMAVGLFAGCGNDEQAGTDTEVTEGSEDGVTDEATEDGTTDAEGTEATEDGSDAVTVETTLTAPVGFEDDVVFTVNGEEIMLSEANVLLYQIKSYYEATYGPTVWAMDAGNGMTVEEFVKEDIQNLAIRTAILGDYAVNNDIALTDEETAELEAQANMVFMSYTQDIVNKYGATQEIVNDLVLGQGLAEMVFEDLTKDTEYDQDELNALLFEDPTYSSIMEMGVEDYYEQVRARHILISTLDDAGQALGEDEKAEALATIEDLRQRALDGEDFAELATEYTEDPGSVSTGGEYTFGRGQMVPEFEEGAYNLEVGGISEVIETSYGYHIIKLEERISVTDEELEQINAMLEGMEDEAKYYLRLDEFDVIYEELKADYDVVVNDELWDAVTIVDTEEAAE